MTPKRLRRVLSRLVTKWSQINWTEDRTMRRCLNNLARPEGFEPPTPRSVVSFKAESQELRHKTRAIIQRMGDSPSQLLRVDPRHCGNRDGNILPWITYHLRTSPN